MIAPASLIMAAISVGGAVQIRVLKSVILLSSVLILSLSACAQQVASIDEEPAAPPAISASESFLPLTSGIRTTFQDGVLVDSSSGARTSGIALEVLDGGLVRITGGFTYPDGSRRLITEELTFSESGSSLLLSRDHVEIRSSDGARSSSVTVNYSPAVVILSDRASVSVGAVATTEHVSVTRTGDVAEFHVNPREGVPENLSDATLSVHISREVDVVIGSVTYPSYLIQMFNPNSAVDYQGSPWFNNLMSYSWGLYLAEGIGISNILGAPAISTTAITR